MSLGVLQSGTAFQAETLLELILGQLALLLGIAFTAGGVSALTALTYRWYVRERVQSGVAVLFGLTVVVLYLGTTTALGQVIGGSDEVLELQVVFKNIAAFGVASIAAFVGTRIGDRLGTDLFAATARQAVDADVSEIVQTVGRVTSVRLPEDIDDIVGYDPMPEATKEKLTNRRFLFPRRLTKDELRARLVARLKTDYGVGHVDIELGDDGAVEYLAIGSRAAGIGPTLPPSTNAVAVQADPAHAASAGDLVQVWEQAPARRVLTGELRGVAGDVVTVAIDAADTPKLDPKTRYKLVTLPVQDRSDREFASLLRAADETMGTATVEAGSSLDGQPVGSVPVTVVAITRDDEPPATIPSRDRVLAPGDTLYAIAKPDALRRLEEATEGTGRPDPAIADAATDDDDSSAGGERDPSAAAEAAPAGDPAGESAAAGGDGTPDEAEPAPNEGEGDAAPAVTRDTGTDEGIEGGGVTEGDAQVTTERGTAADDATDDGAAADPPEGSSDADTSESDGDGTEPTANGDTAAGDAPADSLSVEDGATETEDSPADTDEVMDGLDSLPDAADATADDAGPTDDPLDPLRDASSTDDDVAFDDLVEGDDATLESSADADEPVEVWDPDERIGDEVGADHADASDDGTAGDETAGEADDTTAGDGPEKSS